MILHCFESSRALRHRAGLPALWSAGLHAALVGGTILAALPSFDATDGPSAESLFLLPLLPRPEARQALAAGGPLVYTNGLALPEVGDLPNRLRASSASGGGGLPVATAQAAVVGDSVATLGAFVYTADELDSPVERSAESAGPVYPEALRTQNLEGEVIAEWIVDTTGTADTASFHVLTATHPLFGVAVRDVLPRMRFRPASLGGHPVRQLVRQQFRFQIEAHTVATARRDSA